MKKLLVLLIVLTLSSCNYNSIDDVRKIKKGMSISDLEQVMGEPFSVEVNSDNEEWYFSYSESRLGRKDHIQVVIINDTVVDFMSY